MGSAMRKWGLLVVVASVGALACAGSETSSPGAGGAGGAGGSNGPVGAAGGGGGATAGAGGTGAAGTTGAAGASGAAGTTGVAGTSGAAGTSGTAGTGAAGTSGTAGASGAAGMAGGAGVAGRGGAGGSGGLGAAAGTSAVAGRGGDGGRSTGGSGGAAAGTGGTAAGGAGGGGTSSPATFKIFDQIPQFGMYATSNPRNYTPPAGVLMWNYGSFFVAKLSPTQQSQIGSDLAARITYHAQCDNYDRLASVFFILEPPGQAPKTTDPRIELVRFITPFSNYTRGALATHVYPNADISAYATTLADPSRDVWIGIGGGSNPYDGDPCTNAGVTPEFRAIGYKFSLELVSTKPLAGGPAVTLAGIYYVAATSIPVNATINNPGGSMSGRVTVIVSGHGSAAGGDEYRYTQDTVSVNSSQVGAFSTMINCAPFASFSPDGNPGIFQNNTSSNPRNWCPGALVPSHTYPVTLMTGANRVSLGISPTDVPSGSYYSTSINFSSP
jgi:hypothetical protein